MIKEKFSFDNLVSYFDNKKKVKLNIKMLKNGKSNEFIIGIFNENSSINNNNTTNNCTIKNKNYNLEVINNGSSSKINYLDYTFLSHRNTLSLRQSLSFNSKNATNYLFDLKKTFEINLQLLEQIIKMKYNKTDLNGIFQNFKKKIEEKNNKKKNIMDLCSKILIENQITQELKRKIEENNDYYQEKIIEFETNSTNKDEYLKSFEKKLFEVEIYIQKHTKNLKNSKYEKYKFWKLHSFLDIYNSLIKKKNLLQKDLITIGQTINELKIENEKIIIENKNDIAKLSQLKNTTETKINEYIQKYKKEIFILGNRINILKHYFNQINSDYKYFTLLKTNIKSNNEKKQNDNLNISVNDINKEKDTSNLPLDMTKKLNSFMDFSILLNKKDDSKIEELDKTNNKVGNPFSNLSNTNIWDVSAINKN